MAQGRKNVERRHYSGNGVSLCGYLTDYELNPEKERERSIVENWEDLANAIVIQAVEDCRKAKRKVKADPNNTAAEYTVSECNRFFASEWFATLTKVDPEVIMRAVG